MNHVGYTHCSDYTSNCPKECFRAELTRDLFDNSTLDMARLLLYSWAYFKGTDECKKIFAISVEQAIEKLEIKEEKDDES